MLTADTLQILVVDDEPIIREMMVDMLDLEGYSVQVARNGHDALDLIHQNKEMHFLVFLDLMMPVMDGETFCKEVLQEPDLRRRLIIVAMSALDQLPRAAKMQVDTTMSKPFVVDDVLRILDLYMTPESV